MTEQKRGRGRPKKTVEQAVKNEQAVYDWKDLAFKVQGALESSIQENKELEKKFKDVCIIAIKQQGVIEYLEGLFKKHKPTEEEIERNNNPV
jgi:AT hook motif